MVWSHNNNLIKALMVHMELGSEGVIGQVYRIIEEGMGGMGIEIWDSAGINLEEEKPSFK